MVWSCRKTPKESSDSSSSDEDDEDHLAKKRAAAAKKAKDAAAAAAAWTPTPTKQKAGESPIEIKIKAGTDGAQALSSGKPFRRVDDDHWGEIAMKDGGAMADNSYEGVFGADGYGARSSERLLQVRGKRFQHEKNKKKRTFNGFSKAGGAISQESFSTKFQYSSEDE